MKAEEAETGEPQPAACDVCLGPRPFYVAGKQVACPQVTSIVVVNPHPRPWGAGRVTICRMKREEALRPDSAGGPRAVSGGRGA